MGSIQILDAQTVNKIAAGEVIERPASIVKELLDNALDARATRITIDLEDGGRRLIRITDDGTGMPSEDLPLAVQNHATSKLRSIEDLLHIRSLGFRGEALASIASVCRFTISSRDQDADVAHSLEVIDGQLHPQRPFAAPIGTTVTARELFHNTPARREFLRTPAAERRAVLDLVSSYALLHPQLQILLRADGRDLLDLRPAVTLRERVAEILGRPMEQNLTDVHAEKDSVRVEGLASRPPYGYRNRTQQTVFVNGRPVRDRTVSFAISHAYRHTMESDRFPVVVLFLSLPTGQVDVNVHPTKSEVRFRDDRLLHKVLVMALREATGTLEAAQMDQLPGRARTTSVLRTWNEVTPPMRATQDGMQIAHDIMGAEITGTEPAQPGADTETSAGAPSPAATAEARLAATFAAVTDSATQTRMDLGGALPSAALAGGGTVGEGATEPTPPELLGDEALYWQLHNAYILIQIRSGLVIVDQHAAHERILYDRAVTSLENRNANVQRLLFPITLELSVQQYAAWEEGRELLDQLGFQVRAFGGRSVMVEGIPSEMTSWDEGAVLLGILDDLADNNETRRLPLRDKVLATYACRAAIMQGKKLSLPEMRALMDQLFVTARPYTCPHGRPTLLRMGLTDLDHKFGRP